MRRVFPALLALSLMLLLAACGKQETDQGLGNGWEPTGSMELQYATQFSVDDYPDGYRLVTLADGSRFLVVPPGKEIPFQLLILSCTSTFPVLGSCTIIIFVNSIAGISFPPIC